MKHEHPPIQSHTMRGAFSLGTLQAMVNGGQIAKKMMTWDRQMSEADKKENLRRIQDARSAKALMEEILDSNGFYDGPNGPTLRKIRNQNFDEMFRGEVHIEVYYSESCPTCRGVVGKIQEICQPRDFKIRLTPADESPPGKEWVLESWPHIEVGGHEVTVEMLEDLAIDAGWIRATDSHGDVDES